VKGFIWMRHDHGRWKENFDPHLVGTWYQDSFYEATTWTYSFTFDKTFAVLSR
jgi:putative alpha-1,2-mannosidase